MRLLLLAQFFPPDIGGEERHVFNLANTLAGRGHHVAVATQCLAGTPDEDLLPSGVRVYRFHTIAMRFPGIYSTDRYHHPPLPDPLGVLELRRIIRRERPDIIHAHNWIVNSAVALRRGAPKVPPFGLVLTLHDYSQVCATKRLMRHGRVCAGPSVSRCFSCSAAHYGSLMGPLTTIATTAMRPWKSASIDHVVSVSRAVAIGNHIPSSPASSIIPNFVPDSTVLSSAVDQPEHLPRGPLPATLNSDFMLFVGDISADKGIPVLLRAYESLGADRLPLLMIGRRTADSPAQLPTGAEIHEDWPYEHVLAAFRNCTLAVLPSVWPDPCPTTVLEAMASGRAVVTTSTGGMVDMIDDGQSGLLASPGSVRELAVAMNRLLADEGLRARLGAGALDKVRDFTASAVTTRLEAIYAHVAYDRRRHRRAAQTAD
jgi:glycosyltransferase involved in cell wall biosynthesis